MDFNPELYKQLIDTFKEELAEQLQLITDKLLILEKAPEAKALEDALHAIFRAAHNIKGTARSLELEDIGEVAHRLEDVFHILRDKKIAPSSPMINDCLKVLDAMRDMMSIVLGDKQVTVDKNKVLETLTALLNLAKDSEGTIEEKKKEQAEPVANKLDDKDQEKAEEKTEEKVEKKDPTIKKTDESVDKTSVSSKKEEKTEKEQSSNQTGKMKKEEDSSASFLKVSLDKIEDITSFSDELQSASFSLSDVFELFSKLRSQLEINQELWFQLKKFCKRSDHHDVPESVINALEKGADFSIEMQAELKEMYQTLHTGHAEISRVSTALQDKVRVLRLVPAAMVLQPLQRVVRDIAQELHKEISLDVIGENIEIDRAILELMKDPLQHLLRNAIDHGIELPDERVAKQKAKEGKIQIKVEAHGAQVFISVSDDGAGIDIEKVADAAISRKILSDEERQRLSEAELLNYIFYPGVSTKDIITNYSGRGVGLDVVQTNIQLARGEVVLETKQDQGTTVKLVLPLTLITDRGMLIQVGDQTFAVPTSAVQHVLEIDVNEIKALESGRAIMFQDRPIPVRDLSTVLALNIGSEVLKDKISIIIIAKGHAFVAFIVDKIIGEREIVVKQFMPPIYSLHNLSGATLTARGEIVVVLNPIELVDSALGASSRTRLANLTEEDQQIVTPRILAADDSITTRTLIANILISKGYEVSTAVDGKEALALLKKDHFDLVVTDVMMPNMDGFELTDAIKQDEQLKKMPVIIVTSKATDADKQRGIEVGADAYIVKNQFESKELLDIVEQLL